MILSDAINTIIETIPRVRFVAIMTHADNARQLGDAWIAHAHHVYSVRFDDELAVWIARELNVDDRRNHTSDTMFSRWIEGQLNGCKRDEEGALCF